ncbi:2-oxoacid dehydrogenase acyltransferase [Coniella lustricola]|uniref:Dihydrolipoamide acetyltransferase component of pyruvate dehydrogenase complex n=1 Tax=Coniella lustricola TaxID=2025994 RepID=A0A2T3ABH6_9PEZI|nr:2-oxoacid dehydrogenase acyltransferase [Coniella lustricola]
MFLRRVPRTARLQWHLARCINQASLACGPPIASSRQPLPEPSTHAPFPSTRCFHASTTLRAVKPVLLADIGEGIVECEIIQWFVEPGARVEEFSKLCEVQSDKASVEITSRFEGVVKRLYYEAGEMARVGKPFVDIDILGHVSQEDLQKLTPIPSPTQTPAHESTADSASEAAPVDPRRPVTEAPQKPVVLGSATDGAVETPGPVSASPKPKGRHAALATPAVRHLCKELKIDILEIDGTGRDGRVLKEDIQKFIKAKGNGAAAQPTQSGASADAARPPPPSSTGAQLETRQPLTKMQEGMFKSMTRSLSIPHFLYADEVDFADLSTLRSRLNKVLATPPSSPVQSVRNTEGVSKLSFLPFIVKAVSIALQQYPILNARVDVSSDPAGKPQLVYRTQHNIGVAMDTPSGLLVPVVKDVGAHSILTIAAELARLQGLAVAGKLGPQDLSGGTITVSNIGSIGGTYCSPVIVEGQLAILGIGRVRELPDVTQQSDGEWKIKGMRKVCNFSWSADHRVVDGATMARAAGVVRALIEEPDVMIMNLR